MVFGKVIVIVENKFQNGNLISIYRNLQKMIKMKQKKVT